MRRGEYPDDWDDRRERVLERDNYQCQQCGATDTTLQVHHITPISESGSHEYGNLQTICRSCHAEEHPVKVTLSEALAQNQRIRMKYRSSSGTRVREVEPYALQMHDGIQYLVGYDYFRNEIRHFRPTRIKWATTTDKTFTTPHDFDANRYLSKQLQDRTGQSGCFIATAAYGTPHAEEIDVLRNFRDNILLEYMIGKRFVSIYYKWSPPIAAWIARREWRKSLVRKCIIRPSTWCVRKLIK